TNWVRAIAERPQWDKPMADTALALLADTDAQVQRAAAEALGRHPDFACVSPLTKLWGQTRPEDAMLIHAVKIALRNQLRTESIVARLAELSLTDTDLAHVAEIALAVPNEPAAWFVFEFVRAHDVPPETLARSLTHAARHVGEERINEAAAFVQKKF